MWYDTQISPGTLVLTPLPDGITLAGIEVRGTSRSLSTIKKSLL